MRLPLMVCASTLALAIGSLALAQGQDQFLKTPLAVTGRLDALINDASYNDALKLIAAEERLGPLPPDLQLKRGIVLMQLGDTEEATRVFQHLRDTFPDQPAPYVNLAAIHARADELEAASQDLSKAASLAPRQASTQESLGKVHLGLAWKSFKMASELDPSRQNLMQKNRVIERLIQDNRAPELAQAPMVAEGRAPAPAEVAPTPASFRPAVHAVPSVLMSPPPSPPVAAMVAAAPLTRSVAPMVRGAGGRHDDEAPGSDCPERGAGGACAQAMRTLEGWRQAWAARSFDGYRQFYAPDFRPEGFRNRADWGQHKKRVFRQAGFIEVSLKVLEVQAVSASRVRVRLEQDYASNRLRDKTQKMLELMLENGRWKIALEQAV